MRPGTILTTGVVGAAITAICCFTPALVLLLGFLGLSAWVGWLDHVLLPALVIFVGIIAYGAYGVVRRRQAGTARGEPGSGEAS